MAENTKILPNIEGTETIAKSWRKLLERDRNASNLFSGEGFTTDQDPVQDIGRPNWRTDLNRLFIFNGADFINLFEYLTPEEIRYTVNHPDVPESVQDVKAILDLLVERNNLNTITMPAIGITYIGNGTTFDYTLDRYTNNKYSLYVFIDGVKQNTETYDLAEDGLSIKFKKAPAINESIEILQLASLTEWDYSPSVATFIGDGMTSSFTVAFDILNVNSISVNIDGKELQKSEFSIGSDGKSVILNTIPSEGSNIQIITICKTSFVAVSPNSIGTTELQNGSVTAEKLAENIPVSIENIPAGSITNNLLANSSVSSRNLADNSVTSLSIADGSVTEPKLATAIQNKLLGVENIVTANIGNGVVTKDKLSDALVEEINYATSAINGYTKEESDSKFLSKTDASSTYLSKTDASSTYLSKIDASSTYATHSSLNDLESSLEMTMAEDYLSKTDASSTYLSKTDASSTYITSSSFVIADSLPANPDSNTFYFVKES